MVIPGTQIIGTSGSIMVQTTIVIKLHYYVIIHISTATCGGGVIQQAGSSQQEMLSELRGVQTIAPVRSARAK